MSTDNIQPEVLEEKLTPTEEGELAKNELLVIPEADRKGIQKVTTTHDLALIGKHKKQITTFKRKYKASNYLIAPDMVFDKEKYEKALEAWRDVKNYRTKKIEPDLKELKAPHNAVIKYYNEAGNPIIADSKNIEKPISDYIDKMEELKEAESKKAERELAERTNKRVKELLDAGAAFDGDFYSVGSKEFEIEAISLGMDTINSVPDDIFEKLLKEVTEKAVFIAEKQKAKDDSALLEQQNRDNELKLLRDQNIKVRGRELKSLEFVFDEAGGEYKAFNIIITKKQVEELDLNAWIELIEDAEKKIEDEKTSIIQRDRVNKRTSELLSIGLEKSSSGYIRSYKESDAFIRFTEIELVNDDEWKLLVENATTIIAKQKQDKIDDDLLAEKEMQLSGLRETALAPYWQFVTAPEKLSLGKISEQEFEVLASRVMKQHKTKADADFTAQQNQIRIENEQRLAKLGDEEKYKDFIGRLKELPIPEFTTDEYKGKVSLITKFINGLK